MDKLMDNPWFIKIIALLLALLLYSSVPQTTSKLTDINVPGDQETETISGIPLNAYYDTSNLVVSGLPNNVQVTVTGPISLVQSTKALRNFEVYVDLTKAKIGTQTVKLNVRNISNKLNVTLKPAYVKVSVQEKVTKEFQIFAEYNSGLIADGYTAGTPIIEPNKVSITGAKDVIDNITYVKAILNLRQTMFNTFTQYATVRVLDKDLNKLDVQVEPQTVKVTVPIILTSKTVPIDVTQIGTPPSGVTISSINLDTTQATITGTQDALKNTSQVKVVVDVSKISSDTSLSLPVIIPNGITSVTPKMVTATVKTNKSGGKTISGIQIQTQGLNPKNTVTFKDPANQSINLTVNGPSSVINSLTSGDFNAYIDLTNLTVGDHSVKVQVVGPSGVTWNIDKPTALVTIS